MSSGILYILKRIRQNAQKKNKKIVKIVKNTKIVLTKTDDNDII
jgi:hypothetical protein